MIKVLIADDEPLFRELLRTMIDWEAHGFSIAGEVKNGREALEQVERLRPELVMADISMPFMNGLDFGEQVRKFPFNVHIIYVTGHADFSFTQRAIRLGADDYLLKPFNANELTVALSRVRQRILQEESGPAESDVATAGGMHLAPGAPKSRAQRLVEDARRYIEAHYPDDALSVEALAAGLHVNPGYLRAIFRKECNLTVVDCIVGIRMQHAADLIRAGGIRFSDVAEKVGIPDAAYFSKAFKRHFHVTPSEFENSLGASREAGQERK